ncbi:11599_t:CDS:1 [Ambispora gerdemannii]|uniref:11599_t:CDS:1 n=1 Tax=Ambispora gerdemannii TaxID=144530 RepID=A0A9N9CQB4_9GLOM|nr:11599_t:CDS:1 [Ambispora gerdemannii]
MNTAKAICPQFICEKYQFLNRTLDEFYHWIDRDVDKNMIISRVEQILDDEFINLDEFAQHLVSYHTAKNMLPFIGFLFENFVTLKLHDKNEMSAKRYAMKYYETSAKNENQYGQLFLGNTLFGNHSTKKAIYWLAKAAIQGNIPAKVKLTILFISSQTKIYRALKNYSGNLIAQKYLFYKLRRGEGILKDLHRTLLVSYHLFNDEDISWHEKDAILRQLQFLFRKKI